MVQKSDKLQTPELNSLVITLWPVWDRMWHRDHLVDQLFHAVLISVPVICLVLYLSFWLFLIEKITIFKKSNLTCFYFCVVNFLYKSTFPFFTTLPFDFWCKWAVYVLVWVGTCYWKLKVLVLPLLVSTTSLVAS